jgi:APA family basic amino acid/polyamine antiporter
MKLFTRKPIELLLAQAAEDGAQSLHRGLGIPSLTLMGVGAVIGAGIFVLTGQQAAINAGPGIVLSFVLAGVICAFCALCYAELASMIPVAGSAYTYSYATMGEFVAWIIAWDLILEYGLAAATVAAGWSGYFNAMLSGFGLGLPAALATAPYTYEGGALVATGAVLNVPAVMIIFLMAGALIAGVTKSAFVNNIIVVMKVMIVLMVIAFGFAHVDPALWQPFIPDEVPATGNEPARFGPGGIAAAASVIFFAYIGFEVVSTAAQEAKDPQRTMPWGILLSLAICTVLYVLMALVITGLAPYQSLNDPAPVAVALQNVPELFWMMQVVNIGVAVGLGSTILALLYGQSRIFFAMSRDGLLPAAFGKVSPRTRTPVWGTLIVAAGAAVLAGLFPIKILGELVSMGTLFAFSLICLGVLYLRIKEPQLQRRFRTPVVWLTAPAGAIGCFYLISRLPQDTWWRLAIWMLLGLAVYFGYAYWHSRLHEKRQAAAGQ